MAEAESAPTEVSEGLASSQVWSELRNDIICFCFKDAGLCAVACASMSALENAMSAAIVPVPASPAQTRSNTCMEVEMEQLCRHVCAAADLNGRATRLRLMRLLLAPADVLWKGVSTSTASSAVSSSFVSMVAEHALPMALSKSKACATAPAPGVPLPSHKHAAASMSGAGAGAGAWRRRCTAAAEWLRAVMLLALLRRPTHVTVPTDLAGELQDYAINIGTQHAAHSGSHGDIDVAQLYGALEVVAAQIIGQLTGMEKRYARSARTALSRSLEKWPKKRDACCAEELRLLRFWKPNWKSETQCLMDSAMKPLLDGVGKRSPRAVVAAAADVLDRVLREALRREAKAHDGDADTTLCSTSFSSSELPSTELDAGSGDKDDRARLIDYQKCGQSSKGGDSRVSLLYSRLHKLHVSTHGKDSPHELVSMIRCYSTAACAQQPDIWCANDGEFCKEHIEQLVHFARRVERPGGKDVYQLVRREALRGILRFSERLLWTGRSLEDADERDRFGRAVEVSVIEVLKTKLFLPQSTGSGPGQQDARGMRDLTQLVRSDDWEHLRAIVLKIAEFKPRWTLIEFIRKLLAENPMAESTECLEPCAPGSCSYDAKVFLGLTALHGLHKHWQMKRIEKAQRESLPEAQSCRNSRKSLTFNVRMTVVKLGRQLDDEDNKRFFGQCIGSALQALKSRVEQIESDPPTSGSSQVQVYDCVFIAAMQCLEFLVPTADTFTQVQVMELVVRCWYTQALHSEVRRCAGNVVEKILLKQNSCMLFEAFSKFTRTMRTPDMNPFLDADNEHSQASKQANSLAKLAQLLEREQRRREKAMSSPFHSSDLETATSPWHGVDVDDHEGNVPLIQRELQKMFGIVQHLEESSMLGLCCIDASARKAAMRLLRAVHCLRETLKRERENIQTGDGEETECLAAATSDAVCDENSLYKVFECIARDDWADQQKSKCGVELQHTATEKHWDFDEKYGSFELQVLVSGGEQLVRRGGEGNLEAILAKYTAMEERWSRCLLYAMDVVDDDVMERLKNIWPLMKHRADVLDANIETAKATDLDGGPHAMVTREVRVNAWRHYICFACATASSSVEYEDRTSLFRAVLDDTHLRAPIPSLQDAAVLAVGGAHIHSLDDMILNPHRPELLERQRRACFEDDHGAVQEKVARRSLRDRLVNRSGSSGTPVKLKAQRCDRVPLWVAMCSVYARVTSRLPDDLWERQEKRNVVVDFTRKISDKISQDVTGQAQTKLWCGFCALVCALANKCKQAPLGSPGKTALSPQMRRDWAVCGWRVRSGDTIHSSTKCVADHCYETRGADTKALFSVLFDNGGEPSRWAESDCHLPAGCSPRHREQLELPREACHAMQALLCGGPMFDHISCNDGEGIYDIVQEGSAKANNVIENVFRWSDKFFKLLKQEQKHDLSRNCTQSSLRAAYVVQQKVVETLRAFILMNVQEEGMLVLKPCIMRCSALVWNGETYTEAEDEDRDVISSSYFRVLADLVCHVTESSRTEVCAYARDLWNEISDLCTLSRVLKLALLHVAHEHDRTLRECGLSLVRQMLILERHFGGMAHASSESGLLNATTTEDTVAPHNWSEQHADLLAGTVWDNHCVRGCSDIQTPFGHVRSTDLLHACEQQQLLQAATLSRQISRISANFLVEIFECLQQASLSSRPAITLRQQQQLLRLTIPWLRCGSFRLLASESHFDGAQTPAQQILPLSLLFDVTEQLMNNILLPQTQSWPSSLSHQQVDQLRTAASSDISINDIRQVWTTLTDGKPDNVQAIVSFLCGDGAPNAVDGDLRTSRHIAVWCAKGALHETVGQLSKHVWDEHTTGAHLKAHEIPQSISLLYRPAGTDTEQHEVDQIGGRLIRRAVRGLQLLGDVSYAAERDPSAFEPFVARLLHAAVSLWHFFASSTERVPAFSGGTLSEIDAIAHCRVLLANLVQMFCLVLPVPSTVRTPDHTEGQDEASRERDDCARRLVEQLDPQLHGVDDAAGFDNDGPILFCGYTLPIFVSQLKEIIGNGRFWVQRARQNETDGLRMAYMLPEAWASEAGHWCAPLLLCQGGAARALARCSLAVYTALHPGFGKHKKQSLALCLRILTGVQRSMLLKPPECDKHVHALIAALVSIAGDNVREFSECLVLFPHLVWITLELLHLYMTRRMTTIRNDPGARERAERICDTALQLLDVAFARDTIADTVSEERFLELLNITRPPGQHSTLALQPLILRGLELPSASTQTLVLGLLSRLSLLPCREFVAGHADDAARLILNIVGLLPWLCKCVEWDQPSTTLDHSARWPVPDNELLLRLAQAVQELPVDDIDCGQGQSAKVTAANFIESREELEKALREFAHDLQRLKNDLGNTRTRCEHRERCSAQRLLQLVVPPLVAMCSPSYTALALEALQQRVRAMTSTKHNEANFMLEVLLVAHALLQSLRTVCTQCPDSEMENIHVPHGFADDVRACRRSSVCQEPRVQSLAFDVLIEVEKVESMVQRAQQSSGRAHTGLCRGWADGQGPAKTETETDIEIDAVQQDQENLHVQHRDAARPPRPLQCAHRHVHGQKSGTETESRRNRTHT